MFKLIHLRFSKAHSLFLKSLWMISPKPR